MPWPPRSPPRCHANDPVASPLSRVLFLAVSSHLPFSLTLAVAPTSASTTTTTAMPPAIALSTVAVAVTVADRRHAARAGVQRVVQRGSHRALALSAPAPSDSNLGGPSHSLVWLLLLLVLVLRSPAPWWLWLWLSRLGGSLTRGSVNRERRWK